MSVNLARKLDSFILTNHLKIDANISFSSGLNQTVKMMQNTKNKLCPQSKASSLANVSLYVRMYTNNAVQIMTIADCGLRRRSRAPAGASGRIVPPTRGRYTRTARVHTCRTAASTRCVFFPTTNGRRLAKHSQV